MSTLLIMILGIGVVLILQILFIFTRLKKARPEKILVITGKLDQDPSVTMKVWSKGQTFAWPIIQDYGYLDNTPQFISLQNDLSSSNKDYPSYELQFTSAISNENEKTLKAAKLFYEKSLRQRSDYIKDHLRAAVLNFLDKTQGEMSIEEQENELKEITIYKLDQLGIEVKDFNRIKIS